MSPRLAWTLSLPGHHGPRGRAVHEASERRTFRVDGVAVVALANAEADTAARLALVAAAAAELLRRYGGPGRPAVAVAPVGRIAPVLVEMHEALTLRGLAGGIADAAPNQGRSRSGADDDGPAVFRLALMALDASDAARDGALDELAEAADAPLTVALVDLGDAVELHVASRGLGPGEGSRFGVRLGRLLVAGLAGPSEPLAAMELLEGDERSTTLGAWVGRAVPFPRDVSVETLFREVAERHPDRIAIEEPGRALRYRELASVARAVRDALRDAGVAEGERVGVLMERSIEQVAAFIGILDAGATFVPLDPSYPTDRLGRMAARADLRVVLAAAEDPAADGRLVRAGSPIRVLHIPRGGSTPKGVGAPEPASPGGGLRPAYVMFTSGSTGEPKGVVVPHRAIVRLVRGNDFIELPLGERVLGFAPTSFDASTLEIWGPLLNGGTLVLAPAGRVSLADLAAYIEHGRISTLWLSAALFHAMVDYHLERLAGVRQLLTGGDVVSPAHAGRFLDRFPTCALVDGYGPTENTTFTCCHRVAPGESLALGVPIGRPIANTTVYLLDERGRPVPPGMIGELHAGGDGLALGYLGDDALTAERFIVASFPEARGARLYVTGDLARHRDDGVLEFLGRADRQVKIRGHRVEPAEIEAALMALPGVLDAAVVAVGVGSERSLRAAIVLRADEPRDAAAVRARLALTLPDPSVPSEILFLEALPATANGKVDRNAIARMGSEAPSRAAASPRRPAGGWLELLRSVWADLLPRRAFGIDDAFFDVGGDSLLTLRFVEEVRRRTDVQLPVTLMFEFPTLRALAARLEERGGAAPSPLARSRSSDAGRAVAVIGMAGRFPGAEDVDELWRVLAEGRETVTRFGPEELDVPAALAARPDYVPVRGVLNDVEGFDHALFGMTRREAELCDPQIRVLLETAWRAFEDAGRVPGSAGGLVGVFAGVSHNTYYESCLLPQRDLLDGQGALRVLLGNEKDFVAARIAHRLDLEGPAVSVQTASSTSLTAVAVAVQAIRAGMCDLALAGGASVTVPVRSGQLHEEGAMFSRDGATRTFDADASGTVFSDGAALVLLKRLDAALRDGDRIRAVIHGVGVTSDGRARASFSAPSVRGQARCVATALADAGWSADTISYVEAHGTATPLGDPIEVEALTRAFAESTPRRRFCLIGSLKSNIGHLTAAAGGAGLIKTVLALDRRWIPATLNFERANPAIDFEASPFVVARAGVPWIADGAPRRAGVSSFGAGGSNAHVVLEEWVEDPPPAPADGPQLLPLSAASEPALRELAARLADAVTASEDPLAWIAGTLQQGRRSLAVRAVVVASDRAAAARELRRVAVGETPATSATDARPVFLFPGQGAQYAQMGRGLAAVLPEFARRLEECSDRLGAIEGRSLSDWLADGGDAAQTELARTAIAQPALFAVQWALAHVLIDAGVRPAGMAGHSVGELTAACLAGVMDLATALRVVRERGRLAAQAPAGAMLSVATPASAVEPLLGGGLVVSAWNSPRACVVAGTDESLARLEARLTEEGIAHRRLRTAHAFHSPAMDEAAAAFASFMRGVELRAPTIPFVACPSGLWITDAEATDPAYWGRQLREPVAFERGLETAASVPGAFLLEVGPGGQLAALARHRAAAATGPASGLVAATMDSGSEPAGEHESLLRALGRLWASGCDGLDWARLAHRGEWRRVSLPGYPFERRRCWIDAPPLATPEAAGAPPSDVSGVLAEQRRLIQRQSRILNSFMGES